ncbi:MAG: hypothetical protein H0X47_12395, partial [Nitrospirales bacterium]|nr:hypothetical protein [Nitrospirales bacterium]
MRPRQAASNTRLFGKQAKADCRASSTWLTAASQPRRLLGTAGTGIDSGGTSEKLAGWTGHHGQRDALAARGYWLAFQAVQESLKRILKGENPADVADEDHGT